MTAPALFPIPGGTSPNWVEIEFGRQLRARIRQRIEWIRATTGKPPSIADLAERFDRTPGTICHHIRLLEGIRA